MLVLSLIVGLRALASYYDSRPTRLLNINGVFYTKPCINQDEHIESNVAYDFLRQLNIVNIHSSLAVFKRW